jgi:DNA-directed RNA polymerase specialized sigma24 family protein
VTRLGINYLSPARVRRETYVGDWLPEPIVVAGGPGPAEHAELADSLSMAFLVLLEALSPVQLAVFMLREAFGCGYADVARITGKTEVNCRQISARARHRISAGGQARPQRSLPGVGRKARNSPAGSSRPPTSADGVVQAIRAVVNPDKLGHTGRCL